jgi:hypothetical protein
VPNIWALRAGIATHGLEVEPLRLHEVGGRAVVVAGSRVLFFYDTGDLGMRNLVIVALSNALGHGGVRKVAALFGVTPTYVSMLRGRGNAQGSAGLVKAMGRPKAVSDAQVAQARAWAGEGVAGVQIAARLGCRTR